MTTARKIPSLLALAALLLCSACAVTPAANSGNWMNDVNQSSMGAPLGEALFNH